MSKNKSEGNNTMERYFCKLNSRSQSGLDPSNRPRRPDADSGAIKEQCDTEKDGSSTTSAQDTEKIPSKAEKKAPIQKFRKEWLKSDGYECFEQYENDFNFAWCNICLDKLSIAKGGKSNLSTHLATRRHKEASAKLREAAMNSKIIPLISNSSKVTEAEIKISGWAVENNISFAAVDKLADVLKTIDPNSAVLSSIALGRTKTTAVVNGVIAEVQHDDLVKMMQNSNFSLIIDESTAIGAVKTLVMVVRMVEDNGDDVYRVRDFFYTAVELHLADAQTLYNVIVQQFKSDGIDYKQRLVGFGSDGASVMMGSERSVMRMLKQDCPSLIAIKCTCHSLALCASYACEKLPPYLKQLMRDIYSYLSCSPKRTTEFEMIQSILEIKPLKILHPSATRWLSLESVVKRNIDRFAELVLFFTFQANADNNQTAQRILCHLNDCMTKPLLLFLDYVLPLVNRVNRIFQSESPEFPHMYDEIKSLLMVLLTNICDEEYLKNLEEFDVSGFDQHIKKKSEIYVGKAAEDLIKSGALEETKKDAFFSICCNFYVELIKQINKRFNLKDPVLEKASMIDPTNLEKITDFHSILKQFPSFYHKDEEQSITNEFRELKAALLCKKISLDRSDDMMTCWRKLLGCKRANGKLAFPLLRKFIANFLLIPHSSAAVERVFSQYNLNKTKVRNRLSTKTMDAILRSKCFLKGKGGVQNLKLDSKLNSKFKKSMYNHHT